MFTLSKSLSAITQPMFWLALWWFASLMLMRWRRRTAVVMLWVGLGVLGLLGFRAIPDALIRPLENQYPPLAGSAAATHVGIIVLGGALDHPDSFLAHGQVPLSEAAERMTVPLQLMREHPHLQLVFSGGDGRLRQLGVAESMLAEQFFKEQAVPPDRLVFEDRSRNTRENAERVADMLGERCKQPWLLVTSALHMPRSMTEFRAVGCSVTPFPVDFRTGQSTSWTEYRLAESLRRWEAALHEWIGQVVYTLTRSRA
jgi:uncharacterized SAM-binding protein YcdF (DUF218 family)